MKTYLVLTCLGLVLAGCYSEATVKPDEQEEYKQEDVTVKTKLGTIYELETPWELDALGNITGTGNIVTEVQGLNRIEKKYEPFAGTIPADSIKKISVESFDLGTTFLTVAVTYAVAGIVWAASGGMWGSR